MHIDNGPQKKYPLLGKIIRFFLLSYYHRLNIIDSIHCYILCYSILTIYIKARIYYMYSKDICVLIRYILS